MRSKLWTSCPRLVHAAFYLSLGSCILGQVSLVLFEYGCPLRTLLLENTSSEYRWQTNRQVDIPVVLSMGVSDVCVAWSVASLVDDSTMSDAEFDKQVLRNDGMVSPPTGRGKSMF